MTSRRAIKWDEALLPAAMALAVALVVGDLLIMSFGASPKAVFGMLVEGTWGNPYGIGQTLYKTTTLICTGLAVALPLRAGLVGAPRRNQAVKTAKVNRPQLLPMPKQRSPSDWTALGAPVHQSSSTSTTAEPGRTAAIIAVQPQPSRAAPTCGRA